MIEKRKIKIPKLYIIGIIIIILIALYIIGSWVEWFSPTEIYLLLATFIIGWVAIIIIAILGAAVIGMLLGYRIFAFRNFSPFERGVLEMKEDIKEIKEKLKSLEQELKKK